MAQLIEAVWPVPNTHLPSLADPRGQALLARAGGAGDALIEDGDIIDIPVVSKPVINVQRTRTRSLCTVRYLPGNDWTGIQPAVR